MKIHIYLTFDGNCREAMDFYAKVFGTKIQFTMTYAESQMKDETAPEDMDRIMHMSMTIGTDFGIMGSDTHPCMHKEKYVAGNNTEITLIPNTKQEADRLYAELSEGGVQSMPLEDMWWGSYHGTFTDKFGIKWMIDMASTKEIQMSWELKLAADSLRESAKVSSTIATRLEALLEEPAAKKSKTTNEVDEEEKQG
jgi:PhnB protein